MDSLDGLTPTLMCHLRRGCAYTRALSAKAGLEALGMPMANARALKVVLSLRVVRT